MSESPHHGAEKVPNYHSQDTSAKCGSEGRVVDYKAFDGHQIGFLTYCSVNRFNPKGAKIQPPFWLLDWLFFCLTQEIVQIGLSAPVGGFGILHKNGLKCENQPICNINSWDMIIYQNVL